MPMPSLEELKTARKSLNKRPMPFQESQERIKNFTEVAQGYSETDALLEAARCLSCKTEDCRQGCPVDIAIPDFIKKIKEGDYAGAALKIKETSSLPAICGRVCPQESQCEQYCVRGKKGEPVGIGRLERFAADYERSQGTLKMPEIVPPNGTKVAVIGSGPAGLTCAGELAKLGYSVTIFEALHVAGGVLMYGIPEFRLPKDIVQADIDYVRQLGVDIQTNVIVGRTLQVDELIDQGFKAIFIGTGAGLPNFMGIPGENLNGVYSANRIFNPGKFNERISLPRISDSGPNRQTRSHSGCRQRSDGFCPLCKASGRGRGLYHIPALRKRNACTGRRSRTCS